MKKNNLVSFLSMLTILGATVILPSCTKNDKNALISSDAQNGVIGLGEISAIPAFAKPLNQQQPEKRAFTIKLEDGTLLNFDLTSNVKSQLFGKARSLAGLVTINGKSTMANMLVGENGFEILYQDNDHMYTIRPLSKLDIGYVNPLSKLSDAALKAGIEWLKKQPQIKASDAEVEQKILIAADKIPVQDPDLKYRIVKEKGANYELVDETESSNERVKVEGMPGDDQPASLLPTTKQALGATASRATNGIYYVQVAYMHSTFDYSTEWLWLKYANTYFNQLNTNTMHDPYVYYSPLNLNNSSQLNDYLFRVTWHWGDADTQLSLLKQFISNWGLNNGNNSVVAGFHENSWGSVMGEAAYGTYPSGSNSALIICDDYPNAFAHESGHSLGANHVNNGYDVMYPSIDHNGVFHFDANNINAIKSKMGW